MKTKQLIHSFYTKGMENFKKEILGLNSIELEEFLNELNKNEPQHKSLITPTVINIRKELYIK